MPKPRSLAAAVCFASFDAKEINPYYIKPVLKIKSHDRWSIFLVHTFLDPQNYKNNQEITAQFFPIIVGLGRERGTCSEAQFLPLSSTPLSRPGSLRSLALVPALCRYRCRAAPSVVTPSKGAIYRPFAAVIYTPLGRCCCCCCCCCCRGRWCWALCGIASRQSLLVLLLLLLPLLFGGSRLVGKGAQGACLFSWVDGLCWTPSITRSWQRQKK